MHRTSIAPVGSRKFIAMLGPQRFGSLASFSLSGYLLFLLLFSLSACGAMPTTSSPARTPTPTFTPTPTATPTLAASPKPTPPIPTISNALVTYKGHFGPVIDEAWSPDGTRIASSGDDGTVQVWNAHTGKTLWSTNIGQFAFAVAWSPDGKKVAGGASEGSVSILDATSGAQLAKYTHQHSFIQGLAWSPDSRFIASGSQDTSIDIWNVQTSTLQKIYESPNAVERIAWSPDGNKIASASYDGTVQIWEALTGKRELTYNGNGAPVWEVAWSPDGTRIVSGTGAAGNFDAIHVNNSVQVWNATTGKTLFTYLGVSSKVQTYALAWSPNGKQIASGGDDWLVHVWNASDGHTLLQYHGHSDIVFKVAWSPDGRLLASASADGTVQVWKPQQ